MKPVRVFRNFLTLYAYSFLKFCHYERLLERSEYSDAQSMLTAKQLAINGSGTGVLRTELLS